MESTINGNLHRDLLVDTVLRLPNGNLPRELLVDILLKLPVKVLSRFKCVCKQWCFIIESSSFVKQHFEQERNQERLLIRLWEQNPQVHNDLEVVVHEPDHEVFEEALADDGVHEEYKVALYVDETLSEYQVPYHLQMPYEVALIGPVNGVFCVVSRSARGTMALWNPVLRQFKPLPLVQRVCPQYPGVFHSEVGLGLDPLIGDYKLVMLVYFFDVMIEEVRCVVYVCTSESDSWRLLEDVDPVTSGPHVCSSLGVTYLDGVYYWLFESNDTTTTVAILAFDMMTDKFRKIRVMGPIPQSNLEWLALCGESLALLTYDRNERCIDVWMMVNEGCWIRRSRVGPLDSLRWPLCLWKSDELLLETETGFLTRYNISTQESKIIEAPKDDKHTFLHWVFVYKESIVSIKGEAGKCKLWDPTSDFIKNFFQDSPRQRYP